MLISDLKMTRADIAISCFGQEKEKLYIDCIRHTVKKYYPTRVCVLDAAMFSDGSMRVTYRTLFGVIRWVGWFKEQVGNNTFNRDTRSKKDIYRLKTQPYSLLNIDVRNVPH